MLRFVYIDSYICDIIIHETGSLLPPRYIINFPTKRHWKGKSRYEDIEAGLASLIEEIRRLGRRSLVAQAVGRKMAEEEV